MSTLELKKIVKIYAQKLKQSNIAYSSIFVFGSQVKNNATKHSDIDVAIVSNDLGSLKKRAQLWRVGSDVDSRIEPHGFSVKEFSDKNNSFAREIKRTGIKVV